MGPVAGDEHDIIVTKFEGPNTPCLIRISDDLGFDDQLRDRGSLEELALKDPRYARIKEDLERRERSKRGG